MSLVKTTSIFSLRTVTGSCFFRKDGTSSVLPDLFKLQYDTKTTNTEKANLESKPI